MTHQQFRLLLAVKRPDIARRIRRRRIARMGAIGEPKRIIRIPVPQREPAPKPAQPEPVKVPA